MAEKLKTADQIDHIPENKQDFLCNLPDDAGKCLELIKESMELAVKKSVELFWFTGKVIDHVTCAGDKSIQDIAGETGYGERSLYYMLSIYKAFPAFDNIHTFVDHCISWSSIKEAARLKDPDDRQEVLERITRDELNDDTLPAYVETLLDTSEKEEESSEDNNEQEENTKDKEEDNGNDKKSEDTDNELANWFVKLRDTYVEWRTNMKVELTDIGSHIDTMDDTTKTDDHTYTKCCGLMEEIKKEADKQIRYFEQVKQLIDRT